MQEVNAGRGQRMQKPARLHFGLGFRSEIDSVIVRWPDGTEDNKEIFTGLDVNNIYRLTEGQGTELLFVGIQEIPSIPSLSVYPNPFFEKVRFVYELQEQARVRLEVFDVMGQRVGLLEDRNKAPGKYMNIWKSHGSGIYFYRLFIGERRQSGKLISF